MQHIKLFPCLEKQFAAAPHQDLKYIMLCNQYRLHLYCQLGQLPDSLKKKSFSYVLLRSEKHLWNTVYDKFIVLLGLLANFANLNNNKLILFLCVKEFVCPSNVCVYLYACRVGSEFWSSGHSRCLWRCILMPAVNWHTFRANNLWSDYPGRVVISNVNRLIVWASHPATYKEVLRW